MKPILLIITAIVAISNPAPAQDLTALLQKGLAEEEINRDPAAAIEQYSTLLAEFDKGRQPAATALFRIAECHRKLGDEKAAAERLQQLVTLYPKQEKLVALARQNLKTLGVAPSLPSTSELEMSEEEAKAMIKYQSILRDRPDTIAHSVYISETVKDNHSIATRFLLEQGADPNAKYSTSKRKSEGSPLIDIAVTNSNLSIVKLLLEHGADVTPNALGLCIRVRSSSIEPVLLEAIKKKGEPFDYFPALVSRIADWDEDAFKRLIANGADPKTLNDEGLSLLHYAAALNKEAVCKTLINSYKLSVNQPNKQGLTPLHGAAHGRFPEVVKNLLSLGADPKTLASAHLGDHRSLAETKDFSVLMQMLKRGYQEESENIISILNQLVAAGIDLNHQDSQGNTALHHAVRTAQTSFFFEEGSEDAKKRNSVVAALIKAGANKNIKNKEGEIALDLAENKGFESLLGTKK